MTTESHHHRDDPILARRERIDQAATWAKRAGWLAYGVATCAFFYGIATRFEPRLVQLIVGSLIVGSLLLAPAIVFSYAVAATNREEQGGTYGH